MNPPPLEDAIKTGATAGNFLRQAGAVWAIALAVAVLGGMFIVDRIVMSDRWTRQDHIDFEIRLTKETAAYRARVDAAIEELQRKSSDFDKERAVTSEILRRLDSKMAEVAADVKEMRRGK